MRNILYFTNSGEHYEDIKSSYPNTFLFDVDQKCNYGRLIRSEKIGCNVFNLGCIPVEFVKSVKEDFPGIPALAMIDQSMEEDCLERARFCGSVGVESILEMSHMEEVTDMVNKLLSSTLKPMLVDFDIDVDQYESHYLRRSLVYIEENFVELKGSGEIAKHLGITEVSLSREFQYLSVGPKRLIMLFKVKYAAFLLRNAGYSLEDVAEMSGFTSAKRMTACFKKIYGTSPGRLRKLENCFPEYVFDPEKSGGNVKN